jgi:hypothetical protein
MPFPDVTLKVDGNVVEQVILRYAMEDGFPGGNLQVYIDDHELGEILITPLAELGIKKGNGAWGRLTLKELVALVRPK